MVRALSVAGKLLFIGLAAAGLAQATHVPRSYKARFGDEWKTMDLTVSKVKLNEKPETASNPNDSQEAPGVKIVNGVDATADYSFMVALAVCVFDELYCFQFCGGTLIAPNIVLTAAHCVMDGTEVTALLGRTHLLMESEAEEAIRVTHTVIHSGYNTPSGAVKQHDIALFYLESTSQLTTAALPDSPITDVPVALKVIGWGLSHDSEGADDEYFVPGWYGSGSHMLQEATLNTVSRAYCEDHISSNTYNWYGLSEHQFCAGSDASDDVRVSDTCQGDSGGPALVEVEGAYQIVGVTSWGFGCATPGSPGVYTYVYSYLDWLAFHQSLFVKQAINGVINNFVIRGRRYTRRLGLKLLSAESVSLTSRSLRISNGCDSNHIVDSFCTFSVSVPSSSQYDRTHAITMATDSESTGTYQMRTRSLRRASWRFASHTWYTAGNRVAWRPYDGKIKTQRIGDDKSSCASTYLSAGTLDVTYRVSSEEEFDFLKIFIITNDYRTPDFHLSVSGDLHEQLTLELNEAEQQFVVCYEKDSSKSDGKDLAAINSFQFTPSGRRLRASGNREQFRAPTLVSRKSLPLTVIKD